MWFLFLHIQLAMKLRCTGIMFVVAENNEPSMQFYKRRGAEDLSEGEGWRLFRFDKDSLVKMAAPSEEWRQERGGAEGGDSVPAWFLRFPLTYETCQFIHLL